MDKKSILEAVKKLKTDSTKKNFKQSVDLIINLKDLNLKKTEEQVEFFVTLHHDMGLKRSICAFVGPELKDEAKKVCDVVVEQVDFNKFDKKKAKNLAKKHDYYIAQANIMPQVATTFGKYLGPRGKMPNPKAGCIVPPKASLSPLYKRLQNTLKLSAKTSPVLQVVVGKEDNTEAALVDNIWFVYDQVIHHLPKEKNNVKNMFLKLTMGKPIKIA